MAVREPLAARGIRPIETWYRGCRFRSRLEARWAVFFDHLDIPWEYEPQGYAVGAESRPYLPDFWLPREGIWVEVKGSENRIELPLIQAACAPGIGLPPNRLGITMLLVLGPVPPGPYHLHSCVSQTDDSGPLRSWLMFIAGRHSSSEPFEQLDALTLGLTESPTPRDMGWVVGSQGQQELAPSTRAYAAARSARFEFRSHA